MMIRTLINKNELHLLAKALQAFRFFQVDLDSTTKLLSQYEQLKFINLLTSFKHFDKRLIAYFLAQPELCSSFITLSRKEQKILLKAYGKVIALHAESQLEMKPLLSIESSKAIIYLAKKKELSDENLQLCIDSKPFSIMVRTHSGLSLASKKKIFYFIDSFLPLVDQLDIAKSAQRTQALQKLNKVKLLTQRMYSYFFCEYDPPVMQYFL